ncbi:MAG: hypothetical protein IT207_10675 [Fimbriimonadaceae bacterium]|nr:hypothetical protein [Fimbriimonadaceae bacterium]
MRWMVALAALIPLASCAPQRSRKPENTSLPPPKSDNGTTTLATGKVEVLAKNEKGETAFVVRAASSDIKVGEGVGSSQLRVVDGEIFEAGKLKSRFRADRGTVDQVRRLVHAEGNVVVKDSEGGIAMRADSIRYQDGGDRIEATGRVTVSSTEWKFGPFANLCATPDLQRVATPDRFP